MQIVIRMTLVAVLTTAANGPIAARSFTVDDIIGVRRVQGSDVTGEAHVNNSPDGRHLFAVTKHGEVSSGMSVCELWLFSRDEMQGSSGAPGKSGAGRIVVSFSNNSNRPSIEKARWGTDSKTISFIGRSGDAVAQVFAVSIDGAAPRALTAAKADILEYAVSGETIVYSAERKIDPETLRTAARSGVVVADETLMEISAPERVNWEWLPDFETFVVRAGQPPLRIDEDPLRAMPVIMKFWISPDGHYAITRRRPQEIPAEWEQYQSPAGTQFRYQRAQRGQIPRHGFDSQFVLLDLVRGMAQPLLQSPTGVRLGYYAALVPSIVWSTDSKRAIVAASYLPLTPQLDAEERTVRSRLPAVVVVDLAAGEVEFEVLKRLQNDKQTAEAVTGGFWRDAHTACLEISSNGDLLARGGRKHISCFKREDARWAEGKPKKSMATAKTLAETVKVNEDWNTPAQLVIESRGGTRVVRDFNPQLQDVERDIWEKFEWSDSAGRRWEGALLLPTRRSETGPIPLVIQTHGLRKDRFLPDGSFSSAFVALPLAAAGIAVLEVPDPQRTVLSSSEEGPRMLDAYESAVAALARDKNIDNTRVGLIGFSRTCYHVKYAIAFSTRVKFAAATAADGVDMGYWQYFAFGNGYDAMWQQEPQIKNGGPPLARADLLKWLEHAPGFNTEKISTPLRLESYGRENVLLMWDMFLSLKMQGKPTELVFLEDAPHELVKPVQRKFSLEGNLDWFRFWLQGFVDPAKDKVQQYQRWWRLRDPRG